MLFGEPNGMKAIRDHQPSLCPHRVTESGSIKTHFAASTEVAERPKLNNDDTNHWQHFAVDLPAINPAISVSEHVRVLTEAATYDAAEVHRKSKFFILLLGACHTGWYEVSPY